jgi:uncharacterized membrane protein YsdA (DUF1294 family)/cold shock CspA family protein
MRFTGTLTTWHDDRGFGFIQPAQGGVQLFVHIKAFPAGTGRPSVGQVLTFEVETGTGGRKKARAVQYPVRASDSVAGRRMIRLTRRAARADAPAPWTLPRLLAIPAFALVCALVAWRWGIARPVLLAYGGFSLLALFAYAFDKSAAVANRRRTPEQTLHALGLLGGWPGALLAQQILRHKTSKPGFITTFWATVVLNVAGFVAWHAIVLPTPP